MATIMKTEDGSEILGRIQINFETGEIKDIPMLTPVEMEVERFEFVANQLQGEELNNFWRDVAALSFERFSRLP